MAHDLKTRTIDYTQEQPPEWATPQEKIDFFPKRAAKLICEEVRRAEEKLAAKQTADNKAANA